MEMFLSNLGMNGMYYICNLVTLIFTLKVIHCNKSFVCVQIGMNWMMEISIDCSELGLWMFGA